MIHVFYSATAPSSFIGTSIQSIIQNSRAEFMFHLSLDSDLSEFSTMDRSRFVRITRRFNHQLAFYDRSQLATKFPPDVSKIIYLDAKTIVDLDLEELWNLNLENNIAGGVRVSDKIEPSVVVLDLEKIRRQSDPSLIPKIFDALERHVFSVNRFFELPERFNCPIESETFSRGKIYRFPDSTLLPCDAKDPFGELLMTYFIKTPFCSSHSLANLVNERLKILEELYNSTTQTLQSIQQNLKLKTESL